jgi:hypothetical protein
MCRRCKDLGVRPFSHKCGDDENLEWTEIVAYEQEKPVAASPTDIQPYIADAIRAIPNKVTRVNFKKAVELVLRNWEWK